MGIQFVEAPEKFEKNINFWSENESLR